MRTEREAVQEDSVRTEREAWKRVQTRGMQHKSFMWRLAPANMYYGYADRPAQALIYEINSPTDQPSRGNHALQEY